jgi:hypothetical protein
MFYPWGSRSPKLALPARVRQETTMPIRWIAARHDITRDEGNWQAVVTPSEDELRFAHALGASAKCMMDREHSCKLH